MFGAQLCWPAHKSAHKNTKVAYWRTKVIYYYGEKSFERGCLDAGRLSWFFGREIVAVSDPFDACSYEAILMLNLNLVRISLPEIVG